MFPFEKIMIVTGNPSFDDPTKKDPKILKKFESVAAKQGLKFHQTGLYPPAYFPNRTPPHFEYRLYEGLTTSSPYEAINFDFTERKNALRIYSDIPEIKATPIINFIAKHFLHVQLEEDLSHGGKRTFSVSVEVAAPQSGETDGLIIEKLKSIEAKLVNKKSVDRDTVITLIRDVWQAGINGVSTRNQAVDYIRSKATKEDEHFYDRCVAARLYVKQTCNKKFGIDARWRSLAQYAKLSDAKCRRRHKDAPPGPIETPIAW